MRELAQKQNQIQKGNSINRAGIGGMSPKPVAYTNPILRLQRTIGNQAVMQVLRAQERTTHMPEPQLQRTCACGGGCPKCQNEQAAREHLQTNHAQANESGETVASPIVNEVLHSSGQPLDTSTREFMESRFDHDFSQVRIHTDVLAEKASLAVDAPGFTLGKHIIFAKGQYDPQTSAGSQLLAHELTHVVQQSRSATGAQKVLALTHPSDASEVEAERLSEAVVRGAAKVTPIHALSGGSIARGRFGCGTSTPGAGGGGGGGAAPPTCSGSGPCATGLQCTQPDVAGRGVSTSWTISANLDIEAPTPQVGINTPGHAWVEFSESNGTRYTYGFYPGGIVNPFTYRAAPCIRHPDRFHQACRDRVIPFQVTQIQYQSALGQAQYECQHASYYHLQTNNCMSFVVNVLDWAGQRLPTYRGPVGESGLVCDSPNVLNDTLNRNP